MWGLVRSVLRRGIKQHRRFYALHNVNLQVRSGEIMGVIGRNGAGKSTLLKLLARVIDPTSGSVTLSGRVASLLELGAGFSGDLTVAENISLHVALSGGKEDPELEERILELAELTEYRDVDLDECPGGAAARLSFATLINLNSEIVLADEMLAVGDARFKSMVLERITQVRSEGGCVLFVSHDLRAIAEICDRAIWLDHGRIKLIGTAEEAIRAYEADLDAKTSALDVGSGEAGKIVDLRLTDAAGHQVGSVHVDKANFIECVFQHLRSDIPIGLTIELGFGRRHLVFSKTEMLEATKTGAQAFRSRLKLPGHFLNSGPYQARALLHWREGGELHRGKLVQTGFNAVDSDPTTSVWGGWEGRRVGVVAPKLRWRIDAVEDKPEVLAQT